MLNNEASTLSQLAEIQHFYHVDSTSTESVQSETPRQLNQRELIDISNMSANFNYNFKSYINSALTKNMQMCMSCTVQNVYVFLFMAMLNGTCLVHICVHVHAHAQWPCPCLWLCPCPCPCSFPCPRPRPCSFPRRSPRSCLLYFHTVLMVFFRNSV